VIWGEAAPAPTQSVTSGLTNFQIQLRRSLAFLPPPVEVHVAPAASGRENELLLNALAATAVLAVIWALAFIAVRLP
jgi:hypothetical protein